MYFIWSHVVDEVCSCVTLHLLSIRFTSVTLTTTTNIFHAVQTHFTHDSMYHTLSEELLCFATSRGTPLPGCNNLRLTEYWVQTEKPTLILVHCVTRWVKHDSTNNNDSSALWRIEFNRTTLITVTAVYLWRIEFNRATLITLLVLHCMTYFLLVHYVTYWVKLDNSNDTDSCALCDVVRRICQGVFYLKCSYGEQYVQ